MLIYYVVVNCNKKLCKKNFITLSNFLVVMLVLDEKFQVAPSRDGASAPETGCGSATIEQVPWLHFLCFVRNMAAIFSLDVCFQKCITNYRKIPLKL